MASIASFLDSKASSDEDKPSEGELIATNSKLREQVTALEAENAKLKAEDVLLKKRKASPLGSTSEDVSSGPATKMPVMRVGDYDRNISPFEAAVREQIRSIY
jgi:hypothetical protein